MRPVFQTITTLDPEKKLWGDCLRACIASLFEFDIEHVPHFCDEFLYPEGFYPALQEWLARRDFTYINFPVPAGELEGFKKQLRAMNIAAFHLLGGRNGGNNHIVVAQFGDIVHDPWPKLDSPFRGVLHPDLDGKYEFGMIVKMFRD